MNSQGDTLDDILSMEQDWKSAKTQMDRFYKGQEKEKPDVHNLIHRIRHYRLPPNAKAEARFRLDSLQHSVLLHERMWERQKHYTSGKAQQSSPTPAQASKNGVRVEYLWEQEQARRQDSGLPTEPYHQFRERMHTESMQLGGGKVHAYRAGRI